MPYVAGTNQWLVTNALDFQAALNDVQNNNLVNVITLTKDISVPPSLNGFSLPTLIKHPSQKLQIQGNNCTITVRSGQTNPILSRKFSPGPLAGSNKDSIVIQDMIFDGAASGATNVTCLEIEGVSNLEIKNCDFKNADYGLKLSCINVGDITDCRTINIDNTSFYVNSSATWLGVNYPLLLFYSRNITFNKCWSSLTDKGLYGYIIEQTSNAILHDCVASGGSNKRTINQVLFNSNGGIQELRHNAEFVNTFKIYDLTIDGQVINGFEPCTQPASSNLVGLGSLIRIISMASGVASGSYVKIDGLHLKPIVGSAIVIDSSVRFAPNQYIQSGFTHLYVHNVPYLDPGSQFLTDGGVNLSNINCAVIPTSGTVWEFKETYDANNIFSSTRWVNSIVPYYRLSDNFSFSSRSKKYLTNFMMINNKIVSQ